MVGIGILIVFSSFLYEYLNSAFEFTSFLSIFFDGSKLTV